MPIPPLPNSAPLPPAKRRDPGKARLLVVVPAVLIGAYFGIRHASSPHGWAVDPLGVCVGVFLGIQLHVLTTVALGPLTGARTVWSSVGLGRWLGSAWIAGRLVAFRMLPIVPFTAVPVLTWRRGLKWRLWSGELVALGGQAAVAAALVRQGAPFAAGLGCGVALLVVSTLLNKPGQPTSRLWTLVRLPFGAHQAQRLDEWVFSPAVLRAAQALGGGRIDEARQALAAAGPEAGEAEGGGQRRLWTGCSVALACGESAEAARLAGVLAERSSAQTLRLGALQLYAQAMTDGVEAGVFSAQEALPAFLRTLEAIRSVQPLALRGTDLTAVESLVRHQPAEAAQQAAQAARVAPNALTRARALCTQAIALTQLGRAQEARRALGTAARLAPDLRRIAVVAAMAEGGAAPAAPHRA